MFEVNVHPDYPNFRRVAYQNSSQVPILKVLQDAFRPYERRFVTLGISRMGGFYQRKEYSYQVEHRLLVKRFPNAPFPFEVHSVKGELYKFIECDLNKPSCSAFSVKLLEVVPGRACPVEKVKNYLNEKSRISGSHVAVAETKLVSRHREKL